MFHYESQGSTQEQKSGSAGHEDEGTHNWTYIYNHDYPERGHTITAVKYMACDLPDPRIDS